MFTERLRQPSGSVRARNALGLHIRVGREDLNVLWSRFVVQLIWRDGLTMFLRVVMEIVMFNRVDGGRWTMAHSRLGALMGCLRARARCRSTVVRVSVVVWVVVPVRDWDVSATVWVLEHHLWW